MFLLSLGEYQRVEIQGLKKFDTVTQKDYDDLTFGITNGIDYVLISEVRRSMDIRDLKETMNVIYADNKNKKNVLRHHMMRKTATQSVNSSPQNSKINNNNDMIDEVPALSHITSDFEENQLFNIDDEGNNQYIRTKVLAKIENYKCLYQIDDIISESDGIVIDIGTLTKSLDSNRKHYIKLRFYILYIYGYVCLIVYDLRILKGNSKIQSDSILKLKVEMSLMLIDILKE